MPPDDAVLERLDSLVQDESLMEEFIGAENDEDKDGGLYAEELLEYNKNPTPRLLDPFLPVKGLGAVIGPSDSGKSQFCRQLCLSTVSGQKTFLGYEMNATHKRALIILTEDGYIATAEALNKQKEGLNVDIPAKSLKFKEKGSLNRNELINYIDNELSTNPVDVVLIDSYGDILEGADSNSLTDTRTIMNQFENIANKHNCLILFIHHVKKSAHGKSPDQTDAMGSGAFIQKCRVVINLRPRDNEPDIKLFKVVKGNYISIEYKKKEMSLHFDEEHLIFTAADDTYDEMNVPVTKNKKERSQATWDEIFGGKRFLPRSELVKQMQDILGVSERTADTRLAEAKEKEVLIKHGENYTLMEENADIVVTGK